MPATLTTVPADFGAGGKGLSPSSDPKGTTTLAKLLQELQTAVSTGSTGKIQAGTGSLVAGTFSVSTGIVVTANSKIIITHKGRPTTTVNYAGLAVTARTVGALGVGAFTVEAILADGTIDSDAVGDVDWIIID